MKKCPVCGGSRWVLALAPRNPVERFLLRPLLLRPFLCNHCQVRFHRFSLGSRAERGTHGSPSGDALLKSKQAMDFEELVDELRAAERRLGGSEVEAEKSAAGNSIP